MLREIREECGRQARILGPLGEATQYFRDSTRWYEMVAVFFRVELDRVVAHSPEFELAWLRPDEAVGSFFHACHEWALSRARAEASESSETA